MSSVCTGNECFRVGSWGILWECRLSCLPMFRRTSRFELCDCVPWYDNAVLYWWSRFTGTTTRLYHAPRTIARDAFTAVCHCFCLVSMSLPWLWYIFYVNFFGVQRVPPTRSLFSPPRACPFDVSNSWPIHSCNRSWLTFMNGSIPNATWLTPPSFSFCFLLPGPHPCPSVQGTFRKGNEEVGEEGRCR